MEVLIEEFCEKHCKNCQEICDKGIIETNNIIRCVDRDLTEKK